MPSIIEEFNIKAVEINDQLKLEDGRVITVTGIDSYSNFQRTDGRIVEGSSSWKSLTAEDENGASIYLAGPLPGDLPVQLVDVVEDSDFPNEEELVCYPQLTGSADMTSEGSCEGGTGPVLIEAFQQKSNLDVYYAKETFLNDDSVTPFRMEAVGKVQNLGPVPALRN